MIRHLGRKILQAVEMSALAKPASRRIIEPFAGSGAFSRTFGEKGLVDSAILGEISPRIANLHQNIAASPKRLLEKFAEVVAPINPSGKTVAEDVPYLKSLWQESKRAEGIDKPAIDLVLGNYSRSSNPERSVPRFTPGNYATPSGIARKVKSLSNVTSKGKVLNASFEDTLSNVGKGDFIVADPPYPGSIGYTTGSHSYDKIYENLSSILNDLRSSTSGVVYTNKKGTAAFPWLKFRPRARTKIHG